VPGAVVLVRNGNQTLRVTSGHANVEKRTPMRASDPFRIGSVTKSFAAAVTLQLVGEGRLALDDTVGRWLPGLLPEKNPTIRELLNHTSGLFDYTEDPRFFERLLEHPKAVWTPRRMVRIATAHRPNSAPGSRWWYRTPTRSCSG
jgi:D-alanyl-D-alanine carboxypeptidase